MAGSARGPRQVASDSPSGLGQWFPLCPLPFLPSSVERVGCSIGPRAADCAGAMPPTKSTGRAPKGTLAPLASALAARAAAAPIAGVGNVAVGAAPRPPLRRDSVAEALALPRRSPAKVRDAPLASGAAAAPRGASVSLPESHASRMAAAAASEAPGQRRSLLGGSTVPVARSHEVGAELPQARGVGVHAPLDRADLPVVKQRRRGEFVLRDVQLDDQARADMLGRYEKDKWAATSISTRSSHLSTWVSMLHAWYDGPVNPIPVEVGDIAAVGSLMKACEYRSFHSYASRVKELHVRMGFTWTEQHAQEARQGIRSVTRGQGPARQSAPLCVDAVRQLQYGDGGAECSGGFANAADVFILGACFLLREIELAYARFSHLTLDLAAATVTLELPVSKTDASAIGCCRSWGCVCVVGSPGSDAVMACPFHAAVRHMEYLQRVIVEAGEVYPAGGALFPSSAGHTVTKEAVVRTIERLGGMLGEPLYAPDGTRRFGGHSLRVSGARWLASKGVAAEKIAALARWESQVVLRYIGDASLRDLTASCIRLTQQRGAVLPEIRGVDYGESRDEGHLHQAGGDVVLDGDRLDDYHALRGLVAKVAGDMQQVTQRCSEQEDLIGQLRAQVEDAQLLVKAHDQSVTHKFVLNTQSFVVHTVAGDVHTADSTLWRSICGWRFAASFGGYRFVTNSDHPSVCRTCPRCGMPPL